MNRNSLHIIFVALAVALSLAVVAEAKWTFMVYIAADNNLEQAAVEDIIEMSNVGSNANVNIVVRIDRADDYASTSLLNLGDFTGAKDLLVNQGTVTELRNLGEINTQDPANIQSFITYAIQTYPADHYGLVFWDHGGGWLGYGEDTRLSRRRQANGDLVTPWVLANAVKAAQTATSVAKFNFVGFDSCLMATHETIQQFVGVADYFIGAPELTPFEGWNYNALSLLANDGATTAAVFGKKIADDFLNLSDPPLTQTVVDLSKVNAFTTALNTLSTSLSASMSNLNFAQIISRTRGNALSMSQTPSERDRLSLVDIGHFFNLFLTNLRAAGNYSSTVNAVTTAQTAYNAMINYFTHDPSMNGATGVTIYFPRSAKDYTSAEYSAVPSFGFWKTFLDSYTMPILTPGQVPTNDGSIKISESFVDGKPSWNTGVGVSNPESVSYAYLEFGIYDKNDTDIYHSFGYDRADVDIANGWISGSWDGFFYSACVNTDCYPVYAALWPSLDEKFYWVSLEFSFVFASNAPGGNYNASDVLSAYYQFAINLSTGQSTNQSLFVYFADGGVSEHTPENGDILIPLVLTSNMVTFESSYKPWGDFSGIVYDSASGLDLQTFHVNTIACFAAITLSAENIDGNVTNLDYADINLGCPNAGDSPGGNLVPTAPFNPPSGSTPPQNPPSNVNSPTIPPPLGPFPAPGPDPEVLTPGSPVTGSAQSVTAAFGLAFIALWLSL